MEIQNSHLLLDTCCLLNFYASGQCLGILQIIPAQVAIVEEVKEELIQIDEDEIKKAIAEEILITVDFASDAEEENFVNYAVSLGDGETATGAIAIERGWAIATDDRKAIKFFTKEAPSLQILSTLEIIKHWSEIKQINPIKLREVLHNIQIKGRYCPPERHPLRDWWDKIIKNDYLA